MMLKDIALVKPLLKTPWYARARQYLPTAAAPVVDDRWRMPDAEIVRIEWPADLKRPRCGIVQDYEICPRWTKYCRFLENNGFEYGVYDIHKHDWIEKATHYDTIIGIWSSEPFALPELREKYYFLERFFNKATYPSADDALLYEDKKLEAYIALMHVSEFVPTWVFYDKDDALRVIELLEYPVVSKFVPSSGSVGVQLVRDAAACRRIVLRAFSPRGQKACVTYARQKNCVYLQKFVPNDGYDIRVIVVGNRVFGYYRKVLPGDFRASGMGLVEKRALPPEAMYLARRLNAAVRSPMLVVDMVHGLDDRYHIIEYSPMCRMDTPAQLHVEGVPGAYVFTDEERYRFEPGRYWLHELALREFLQDRYLGGSGNNAHGATVYAAV